MKFYNVTKKEFKDIVESDNKIICWGAGKNAEKCINDLGIKDMINYFVDSDSNKWGTFYKEWKIFDPKNLEGESGILLVTPQNFFPIIREVWDKFDKIKVYCYVLMNTYIPEINDLKDLWYYTRLIKPSLDRYRHNLEDEGIDLFKIDKLVEEKCKDIGKKRNGEYPLILPRLILYLTEKCTLNCIGCSAFVDKFELPKHMDKDKLINGMKKIFSSIDGCINVQLGGGEIFLYPQLKEILFYLLQEEKCEKIGIITNGTIIPQEDILKVLVNKKIFVEMSDYGLIDVQAKVIRKFEEFGINFKVFCEQIWLDYGNPEVKLNKKEETLKEEYLGCPDGYMCKPFDGDRIYSCGRSMRMHHINIKDFEFENDSFMIQQENIREGIRNLYLQELVTACDYCSRMSSGVAKIPVGIQKNRKLQKSNYTIISRTELLKLRENKIK